MDYHQNLAREYYHLACIEKVVDPENNFIINDQYKDLPLIRLRPVIESIQQVCHYYFKRKNELLKLKYSLPETNLKYNPLISVIMPAFNDEDSIAQSIDSISYQTYDNWELIIIDDGSTDNTKNVVEELIKKDPRIKYFYQDNTGVAGARNTGIKLSKGEYIKLCDSDDILLPYGLDILVRSIDYTDETTGIFYDDMISYYQDKDFYVIKEMHDPLAKPKIFIQQMIGNIFPVGSVLIKREVFDKIGFFDQYLNGTDDFDLWNRVICEYNVYKINLLPVYIQVNHSEQLSLDIETLRIYTDLSLLKLLNKIDLNTFFENGINNFFKNDNISEFFDKLIQNMCIRYDVTYESIFKVIDFIQNIDYQIEREDLKLSLIAENDQRIIINYQEYLKEPKKHFENFQNVIDYFQKCFDKRRRMYKFISLEEKKIIAKLYQYTDFFIEFKNENDSYYIIYSAYQLGFLPLEWVANFNHNIDQIWVSSQKIKDLYIESGVVDSRIKIIEEPQKNHQINEGSLEKIQLTLQELKGIAIRFSEEIKVPELIAESKKIILGQSQRALSIYAELYNFDNRNIDYINNLAQANMQLKFYKKAVDLFSRAINLGLKNKKIFSDIAFCLEQLGADKTAEVFRKREQDIL